MATNSVASIYEASSKLAKYPFEPYWPEKKLKICITGAGGFIARYVR
jgi:GDP-D-mannose 3',5'-epimerase